MIENTKHNVDTFMSNTQYFATCPKGLENLLLQEIQDLGGEDLRETVAGVHFSGDHSLLYRACLWSRLANRILYPLCQTAVHDAKDIYRIVHEVPWEAHLLSTGTLRVDFFGTDPHIRHTNFGAQTVKDAIVDRIREKTGQRPSVNRDNPDMVIHAQLRKGRVQISLDMSAESLHKRGYREEQGIAPLKENLAVALLIRAGWPAIFQRGGALIDPMCGSGTFLLEGAMMAADIAPGLGRDRFGFHGWRQFDESQFRQIKEAAVERGEKGLASDLPEMRGYDIDISMVAKSEQNIRAAGLEKWVRVSRKAVREFKKPTHKTLNPGLVICNPPYGERLGEVEALKSTYHALAQALKAELPDWTLAVFTGNPELGQALRLRARKKYKFYNGTIPSQLALFDLVSGDEASLRVDYDEKKYDEKKYDEKKQDDQKNDDQKNDDQKNDDQKNWEQIKDREQKNREQKNREQVAINPWKKKSGDRALSSRASETDPTSKDGVLSAGAQMVANRIARNRKRLKPWRQKEGIECYRVYDADLPEYAAAIDVYDKRIHLQEYVAPASIDEQLASERFNALVAAVVQSFCVAKEDIFIKARRRNKGKTQYEKNYVGALNEQHFFQVHEGRAKFLVNLQDYLDSGLFLDHRPLRQRIGGQISGKKFLNLFCYTATASVHAALGGAASSTSVDMSNTYLAWAEKNYKLNNMHKKRHLLERADCFTWLKNCREGYDVILLDPPSFSNSKKMASTLDIQRDHVSIIRRCMDILLPGGKLYFSNNMRKFKLDPSLAQQYEVLDINNETLDPDFKGNPKIHHCWQIVEKSS